MGRGTIQSREVPRESEPRSVSGNGHRVRAPTRYRLADASHGDADPFGPVDRQAQDRDLAIGVGEGFVPVGRPGRECPRTVDLAKHDLVVTDAIGEHGHLSLKLDLRLHERDHACPFWVRAHQAGGEEDLRGRDGRDLEHLGVGNRAPTELVDDASGTREEATETRIVDRDLGCSWGCRGGCLDQVRVERECEALMKLADHRLLDPGYVSLVEAGKSDSDRPRGTVNQSPTLLGPRLRDGDVRGPLVLDRDLRIPVVVEDIEQLGDVARDDRRRGTLLTCDRDCLVSYPG